MLKSLKNKEDTKNNHTLNSFIMGKISSSRASLVTSPPRKSILLPTRITGTWTTSQTWSQNIQWKLAHWHQVDEIVVANMWVFDQMSLDCRPSILHIWRVLCGFQTRGAVYLADQLAFYEAHQLTEVWHKSLRTYRLNQLYKSLHSLVLLLEVWWLPERYAGPTHAKSMDPT